MQDEITYKLLKSIEENPSQSQRQLSRSLEISLGKLNYCLQALIKTGVVKAWNFSRSPKKSGYLYLLTAKGVEEKSKITLRFLKKKNMEYEQIRAEIELLKKEARNEKHV